MNPTPEEMIAWMENQCADGCDVEIRFNYVDNNKYEVRSQFGYWNEGRTLEEAIAAAMKESAK